MAHGRDKTGRMLDKKARELRTMMLARQWRMSELHKKRQELHKTPQERDKKIQGPHMLMQGPHKMMQGPHMLIRDPHKKPLGRDRQVLEPHRRPPHGRLGEHHNQWLVHRWGRLGRGKGEERSQGAGGGHLEV